MHLYCLKCTEGIIFNYELSILKSAMHYLFKKLKKVYLNI